MLGDARGEGGTWRAQRSADTGTAPGGGPRNPGGSPKPGEGENRAQRLRGTLRPPPVIPCWRIAG